MSTTHFYSAIRAFKTMKMARSHNELITNVLQNCQFYNPKLALLAAKTGTFGR